VDVSRCRWRRVHVDWTRVFNTRHKRDCLENLKARFDFHKLFAERKVIEIAQVYYASNGAAWLACQSLRCAPLDEFAL